MENFITVLKDMKKRFEIGDTIKEIQEKELEKFYYLLMERKETDD